ncbi:MAG: hypothetical protein UR68_C0017G0027 [Candidatus Roizmanbacteria bacterium GW2011_GWA2_35_19]|uniref:Uncharacterized protein n=1 Tax=Candidatus Roizmanbacteria bacterium GW2011_GWA2_35_19 TaxID=1618478 RepID=A0A0G0C8A1_9BACT|nr:MAG: hypothetical protein UR68_C0017G0027 [Candidatus Roizmanbacteria bacterium GW2011_GWA2_35_19]
MSDASADSVVVSIKNPQGQTTISSGNVNIKVKITSVKKLKNVKIKLNGSEIKNYNEDKREVDETISITTDGVYELQVSAVNEDDKTGESTIKFGVNKPWDYVTPLSATPTPIFSPTPTPI